MDRRHLLKFVLAGFTLPFAATASAAQAVTQVRSWRTADRLRIVLDLSGPVNFRSFALAAPTLPFTH